MSMRRHPLAALLSPRSIAFVGASARPNTPGHDMMRMIRTGGFAGTVLRRQSQPRRDRGLPVRARICADLPAPPDLAVLAVRNERLEGRLARSDRHRREGRGDLRFGLARRRTSSPPLTSGSPRWRAQRAACRCAARIAWASTTISTMSGSAASRARARRGPRLDRVHRPFRQRVRRARAQRSAACASRSPFRPARSSPRRWPTTSTTRSSGRR